MDSKKPLYKYKTLWVLSLFLLYSALGFFAVPYFIKKQATKYFSNELNSQIEIGKVKFNPFSISTDLESIKVTDVDSTLWLKAENIHVNVNLWNTLINHLSFDKVHLNNPHYYLYMDDSVASRIKYPKLKPTQNNETNDDILLDIDLININKGAINFNSQSTKKQVNLNLREILFHHDSFTTLDNNNLFSLSFITVKDEKANIDGRFNLIQSSYEIKWSIDSFQTATLFHIIGDDNDSLNGFTNQSGVINANGTVKSLEKNELPEIKISNININDFSNKTINDDQLMLSLPNLSTNNIDIDLNNENITIEKVNLEKSNIAISFDESFAPIIDKNEEEMTGEQNTQWNYSINSISANNTLLTINKYQNNNASSNNIDIESLNIENLSSLENQTTDIAFNSIIDTQGTVNIVSKMKQNPFELDNTIKFKELNINKWQAWVPKDILIEISSGLLTLEQELTYKNNEFRSDGWFVFNDLSLMDNNKQPFFSIGQLDLKNSTIDSSKKTISLGSIILDKAEGELIVSEDKQLNVSNIVSTSTTQQGQEPPEKDDWVIDIKEVELIDAQTSLTDKSIKPNYHTELSKVNGTIKGLSSENLSKADVNLSGLLDTYGKLKVDGQINPLSENAFTDISINIENLSLQNFSSYSGQFLGFPISRGKVDFKLDYKLNQNLLKGINDLTFKQLKFGDKTPSKDAVNLPLKLAVGLLTDGKGIMKINLPVSGNINDPEFSYGGIVFKAFFKLITGIVASPFKLLGKLVPGGADLDLSGIQFHAGTTELEQQELAKLDAMKKILKQRPGIILELNGVVNTINDTKAIKLQQLLSLLDLQEKPEFTVEYKTEPLKNLYLTIIGEEKWQQLVTNATTEGVINNQLLADNAWKELFAFQNTDGKLSLLAKDRALYIQSQLIENYEVSVDKIFIKPNEMSDELYPQVKFGVGQ